MFCPFHALVEAGFAFRGELLAIGDEFGPQFFCEVIGKVCWRKRGQDQPSPAVIDSAVQNDPRRIPALLSLIEARKGDLVEEVRVPDIGEGVGQLGGIGDTKIDHLPAKCPELEIQLHVFFEGRKKLQVGWREPVRCQNCF